MLIGTEFKGLSTETITYLPTFHAKGLNLNDLNTETSADQLTTKNTTKMYNINCDNLIYNLGSECTEYCFLKVMPFAKVTLLNKECAFDHSGAFDRSDAGDKGGAVGRCDTFGRCNAFGRGDAFYRQ